ncbi:MAG: hypothetical protein AAGA00_01270 [Pseudomonadota bacterium]
MKFTKSLLPALAATVLMWMPAGAVDTRKLELTMSIGGKPYDVVAEPFASWQLASEGQISLDQKFNIQPDGQAGIIQVKIAPGAKGSKVPNPCGLLRGLSQSLKQSGLRLSPGRKPQINMIPVCSMVAESSLKTMFYYSASFVTDGLLIAGVARNSRDLTDDQINEFSRYLASIQVKPKEVTQ